MKLFLLTYLNGCVCRLFSEIVFLNIFFCIEKNHFQLFSIVCPLFSKKFFHLFLQFLLVIFLAFRICFINEAKQVLGSFPFDLEVK